MSYTLKFEFAEGDRVRVRGDAPSAFKDQEGVVLEVSHRDHATWYRIGFNGTAEGEELRGFHLERATAEPEVADLLAEIQALRQQVDALRSEVAMIPRGYPYPYLCPVPTPRRCPVYPVSIPAFPLVPYEITCTSGTGVCPQ